MNSKKIEIKVIPNAKKEEIVDGENFVRVYVKEQAEKNKANIAVLKLLKEKFNANEVKLISGAKSRKKVVELIY